MGRQPWHGADEVRSLSLSLSLCSALLSARDHMSHPRFPDADTQIDTAGGSWIFIAQLLDSDHVDTFHVRCVNSKCVIHSLKDYEKLGYDSSSTPLHTSPHHLVPVLLCLRAHPHAPLVHTARTRPMEKLRRRLHFR